MRQTDERTQLLERVAEAAKRYHCVVDKQLTRFDPVNFEEEGQAWLELEAALEELRQLSITID